MKLKIFIERCKTWFIVLLLVFIVADIDYTVNTQYVRFSNKREATLKDHALGSLWHTGNLAFVWMKHKTNINKVVN